MSLFTCVKRQLPESDGNSETTLENEETNPLDVTLDGIAKDLLSFLNGFKSFCGAKEKIEKIYKIEKEHGDCWPADDIKRVWVQTKKMNIKSSRRRNWAHVIIFQMLKRFMVYDECKPTAAQGDYNDKTNETKQSCETRPGMKENSEDRSSQSTAELVTVGAAGGDEQMFRAGKKTLCYYKYNSAVSSESQHSASSTDVAPSPTEVNPIANSIGLSVIGSQGKIGTQCPAGSQETVNSQPGADVSAAPSDDEKNMDIVDECKCICIPLSKFSSETTESPDANTNTDPNADTNLKYTYKLIDQSPSNTEHCKYIYKKMYAMAYDTDKKNAKWVYEILNKSTVPFTPKKLNFKKDLSISLEEQAVESKDGFDDKDYIRGHLAAAGNHKWCQDAYNDTYLVNNMTPQLTSINNGIWKTLENHCRRSVYEDKVFNVHVYTGPLYQNNNEELLMKGKTVPTHYFKIVIIENENGKAKVECYIVENKKEESETTDNISTDNQQQQQKKKKSLSDYRSDIKTIENMCGVTFTETSDNNRVMVKKTLTCTGDRESKRATIEVKCLQ